MLPIILTPSNWVKSDLAGKQPPAEETSFSVLKLLSLAAAQK